MWIPKGMTLIREWRLFEAQLLLEEIWYIPKETGERYRGPFQISMLEHFLLR